MGWLGDFGLALAVTVIALILITIIAGVSYLLPLGRPQVALVVFYAVGLVTVAIRLE